MPTKQTKRNEEPRGPGRPALDPAHDTVPVTIRMTPPQRDKLARLGGPQWVRDRIDKAKEQVPPEASTDAQRP